MQRINSEEPLATTGRVMTQKSTIQTNEILLQVATHTVEFTWAMRIGEMPAPTEVRVCRACCAILLAPMPGDGMLPGCIGAMLPA